MGYSWWSKGECFQGESDRSLEGEAETRSGRTERLESESGEFELFLTAIKSLLGRHCKTLDKTSKQKWLSGGHVITPIIIIILQTLIEHVSL